MDDILRPKTKGNFGDAASYLVEKGADANDVYVDEGGDRHSLLMDAIIVENVAFAELLVKHGADVNVTDEQGVTTLIQVRIAGARNTSRIEPRAEFVAVNEGRQQLMTTSC